MATLFILLCVAVATLAIPTPFPPTSTSRNTIFIDELLEGEVFEDKLNSEKADTTIPDKSMYRLPTTTKPVRYDVLWIVDMERLTFSGNVAIQLYATEANVTEIVIHSKELSIATVKLEQGTTEVNSTYASDETLQFLRVTPESVLQYNAASPVVYTLTIGFGADLRKDMYGLYRSWYKNNQTEAVKWMATTQFQSTSSRSAFPCYDEPSFKAQFKTTIRRPVGFKSWSNTKLERTIQSSVQGYEDDIYKLTPVMSTYLIALIVAEYDSKALNDTNNELKYEVIARPGAMEENQGDYAFEVGQKLLDEMSTHTGIDFFAQSPNLKMTQASIPDFSAGAMENWGLLTYREAYLMYDKDHTHDNAKQIIAYILSHEIAHMWFGNLVTCDWWGHTWLNEGFARYYQYFLTHWVENEMGFDKRFVVEQVHAAMLTDSGNNPYPLSNPNVFDPAEASNMFTTLSYNKGASVIRMTEHLLGTAVHTQGLRNYLKARQYKTVVPSDLSSELQKVAVSSGAISQYGSDFSVVEYYKTWHDQAGVPVIYVQVNHKTGDMTITQRRFNINTGYSNAKFNWQIPITFATKSNPDFANTKPSHVIKDSVSVINRGTTGDEWVVFNKQQLGYYRVNYDDYTWDLIILALRGSDRTKIHVDNRAQIVNDVFQFARSGLMTYTRAFNILSFLQYETDYAPWVAAMSGFTWLRARLVGTPLLTKLESRIVEWSKPLMDSLGYTAKESDTFMTSYLRRQVAPYMCNLGVEACKTAATTQFRNLVDNGVEVEVNSRNWVYCNGLRSGTYEDYAFMWKRYLEHNVYSEKIQLLQTLGCTPHKRALDELLTSLVEENYEIRPQDYSTTYSTAVSGNEGNTQIVFDYIKNNLAKVTTAFGSASSPLSRVAARLRTPEQIDAYQLWLNQTKEALGSAYDGAYSAGESARASIEFATEITADLDGYLTNGDDEITPSTPSPDPVTDGSTVTKPDVTNPTTPNLPDSAISAALSSSLLVFVLIYNIVL